MDEQPDYLAYLLRLWRASTEEGAVWRASVDSPQTGERHGFAGLAALFAFLEERTDDLSQSLVEIHAGRLGRVCTTGRGMNDEV